MRGWLLEGIPQFLRRQFDLAADEEAIFTQKSQESDSFRDAFCFKNGATVLLQALPEGQRARVLRLSSEVAPEHEVLLHERY